MTRAVFTWVAFGLVAAVHAAEPTRPFSQTLTAAEKQRLGLSHLSAAQLAELDAAIGAYTRGETTVAVQQAVQQVERKTEEKVQQAEKKAAVAAETAVAEYKKQQEPGVVARTLERFKRKQDEEQRERFTGRVVGVFRGWRGGTYFPLDNGQVWRQTGTETNELAPVQDAEVEIYKSSNGYWRLKYGGAWITVKRLQ
jgi:hypothetical protein